MFNLYNFIFLSLSCFLKKRTIFNFLQLRFCNNESIFRYPLFEAVHQICKGEVPPTQLIEFIRNHPNHED